ncbi:insecticidal toxin complex protein TcaB [Photorhabdus hindustanensis]|uniref:Insecticidal toxin complex protein TccB n=1 Tax=Photorhabdus hindustanensis TaxID=2918802 RepID=A0A2S8PVZ4_9GAMM|nr:insecticidal toxin complex protein TcaB [Photorhabdus hindustanensis]PQQ23108.1 insecticidal toxin complex protein TccB [Photorhabdus hindustanensis]
MSESLFTQTLKEARRDALVAHYIATQVPADLKESIQTADDLYEYLLLDTKISDLVTTSPLSEAIGSLQLFIHRAIEGYDGTLADSAKPYFADEQFLYNWDSFNHRYSTWAGKERLKFYAGDYIDPTLRLNKTEIFTAFEQGISQGKLKSELVESKLRDYLISYDTLATLDYITACQGKDNKTIFFIGRTQNAPYAFYWRKLTLITDGGKLKPDQWSEWRAINAGISEAYSGHVEPFWENNKLHIRWFTISKEDKIDFVYKNIWVMSSDYSWASKKKILELSFTDYNRVGATGSSSPTEVASQYGSDAQMNISDDGTVLIFQNAGGATPSTGVTLCYDSGNVIKNLSSTGSANLSSKDYATTKLRMCHGQSYNDNNYCNFTLSINTIEFTSYGTFSSDGKQFTPPSGSAIDLHLPNYVDLNALLDISLDSLLNYDVQGQFGGSNPVDNFSGPYGIYLWEIFFHIPFLVAVRMQTEQRYEDADTWYKYIFRSAGYRDANGQLIMDGSKPRYWNVMPLQLDTAWDTTQPATTDPDVIAMADPMHYKLAIFLHTLDLLIARGDSAYRQLERDTLVEAKMYYIQAQQLLGPRPDIHTTNTWPNPTLSKEAGAIATPTFLSSPEVMTFAAWLSAGDTANIGDGDFLPPYNDVLLGYWDKLELRLYNLRHNLSLDGQPLNLPLYATPVDPKTLQRQQAGGDSTGSSPAGGQGSVQGWRYPLLVERARSAVSLLTQFGNSLQTTLEHQDNEKMTLLLQTQQQAILKQQHDIQQNNLKGLQHSLTALQASRDGATLRQKHYSDLINGGLSAAEIAGLTLRSTAMITNGVATGLLIAGGIANAVPNVFGLANGGSEWGAPLIGSGQATQVGAGIQDQSAGISEVTAGYQRRQEEWALQRDIADNEITQLDAQIQSLQEQITMTQKQITLSETEQANAQAIYDLQTTRFTGQALYNWMAGRLSALYYQMYDSTLPICLQAKAALVQELGEKDSDSLFQVPVWNDLWQGLLAGEGLSSELQKLDAIWLARGGIGLEAIRTVSLDTLFGAGTLSENINKVLNGEKVPASGGVTLTLTGDIFQATLDLSQLGLDNSYNLGNEKKRRIKRIAVTLPTLLGPYQDLEATLVMGAEIAALSHGVNDGGRFVTDFNDSRFLPFEGRDATTGTLGLNIFHAGKEGAQHELVAHLSDIIVHLNYIIRDA